MNERFDPTQAGSGGEPDQSRLWPDEGDWIEDSPARTRRRPAPVRNTTADASEGVARSPRVPRPAESSETPDSPTEMSAAGLPGDTDEDGSPEASETAGSSGEWELNRHVGNAAHGTGQGRFDGDDRTPRGDRDVGGAGFHGHDNLPAPRNPRGHYPAATRDLLPAYFSPDSGYAEQVAQDGKIDFRKYLWLLFKHRWLILGVAGVFLVIGLVWTLLTTPIYRASATLQIDREVQKVVNLQDLQQPDGGRDSEFYQTQYELLKSRSLSQRVAESLDLGNDPVFLAADAPSPWVKLRQSIFGGKPQDAKAGLAARQEAAAGRLQSGLLVEPVRSSSVVQISFDSPNATVAAKVVNAVQDNFIAANLQRRLESSSYAKTFLEERIQELKVKLEDSEKQLVGYADKQDIVDIEVGTTGADSQNLVATNLAAANDALTKARADRIHNELLWRQADASDGLALPQILDNKSVQDIRAKRAELDAEYQDKLKSFKPAFPDMVQLKAHIDELDRQIATEVTLVKASLKGQYDASVEQETRLAQQVEELKDSFIDMRGRNIQYNILKREVDTNRTLYDGLLQRYKEIGVAGGVGTNNISIVDRAQVPGVPYTPNLKSNLLKALMLGFLVGGLAAFGREQLDDSFRSPEDIEENLGLPLLGIVPMADTVDDPKKLWEDPRSAVSEAYRSLRTALQFSTASGMPKTLLVTSSRPSEGKSTTAYALARNFAQLGQRVLLIDGDLRKPSLNNFMHCDDSAGLTNCLAGNTKPPEVFHPTDIPTLTFLPCGPLPPNPAELLAGPKMLSLLTIASEKFDLVVVDGPPVAGLADAPLLSSVAAGTLLVIEASRTRRGIARTALKRLHFARAQMIGVVLNKLDSNKGGYSYEYGYGYGYGDKEYYGYGADAARQLTHADTKET